MHKLICCILFMFVTAGCASVPALTPTNTPAPTLTSTNTSAPAPTLTNTTAPAMTPTITPDLCAGATSAGARQRFTFEQIAPWVNGGAWIETESGKVDFLYRNLDLVRKTIRQAQQGIYKHDMETLGSFKILPEDYTNNILGILACPGARRTELVSSVARLEVAWQSVACLAGFSHKPKY